LGVFVSIAGSTISVANAQLIDGRFQIMDEGQTVKDVKTKLIWTRCSVGQEFKDNVCSGSADAMYLSNANKMLKVINADSSGFAGARNWRIPTVKEWADLRDCSKGERDTTSVTVFGKTMTKEVTVNIPTNKGSVAVPWNCPLSAIKEVFLNPPIAGNDPYFTSTTNNNAATYILGDLWSFWYAKGGVNTLDMGRDKAYVRLVRNAN
jgi:Protein of unknown function (DUF1566)